MVRTSKPTKNRQRRALTYLGILALVALVTFLLWKERTEILYILATLGVTALLIVVALADLGHSEESSQLSDAQAAGSGISSSAPKVSKK